jgi:hypothetical protein
MLLTKLSTLSVTVPNAPYFPHLHFTQLGIMRVENRQQNLAPEHVQRIPAVHILLGLGDGNLLPVLLQVRLAEGVSRAAEDTEVDCTTRSAGGAVERRWETYLHYGPTLRTHHTCKPCRHRSCI